MFPQTLGMAVWLLYLNGFFGLVAYLDKTGIEGAWRFRGGIGSLVAFLAILTFPLGGFLMANGKLLGWYTAIVASFSPFALRLAWKLFVYDGTSVRAVVIGDSYFSFAFEAALCALLLHRMTREHAQRWFK